MMELSPEYVFLIEPSNQFSPSSSFCFFITRTLHRFGIHSLKSHGSSPVPRAGDCKLCFSDALATLLRVCSGLEKSTLFFAQTSPATLTLATAMVGWRDSHSSLLDRATGSGQAQAHAQAESRESRASLTLAFCFLDYALSLCSSCGLV